jgi:hypothetical protein
MQATSVVECVRHDLTAHTALELGWRTAHLLNTKTGTDYTSCCTSATEYKRDKSKIFISLRSIYIGCGRLTLGKVK